MHVQFFSDVTKTPRQNCEKSGTIASSKLCHKDEKMKPTSAMLFKGRFSSQRKNSASKKQSCKTKQTKSLAVLCVFGMLLSISIFSDMTVFAEPYGNTIVKLDQETSLQKTITTMTVPQDNTLPWGTVKGKIIDPAQGYPVIIQFFKPGEKSPIHVAQVDLKGDDSFEYKFRVLSINEGIVTHFFKGNYDVKIFKVINTPDGNLDSV
jgi:hypothetical protein